MKISRCLFSTLAMSLLLGTTVLIYAQDEHGDSKPPQEPARPEAAKPPQDEGKPPKPNEVKPPRGDEKPPAHEEAKPPHQEERAAPPDKHAERPAERSSARIPDDKFRAHFGRQHTLVIHHTTVVEGQPRFQYGGYWFTLVDAWPVGWAYTDECYIDDIDGEYFLFDLLHPGVRVALVFVL